jgi:hypothetical protein
MAIQAIVDASRFLAVGSAYFHFSTSSWTYISKFSLVRLNVQGFLPLSAKPMIPLCAGKSRPAVFFLRWSPT